MATNYYFSAKANAFYPAALRARYTQVGTWPSDAQPVTDALFATYGTGAPPVGQTRGVSATGAPVWVTDTAASSIPLATQAAQALAQARGTVWASYGSLGEAVPTAWVLYQKALGAIVDGTDTTSTTLPAAPSVMA